MSKPDHSLLGIVDRYYSEKVRDHGPTARGVDWNGPESQTLRFAHLLNVAGERRKFSINDLGCGYGALCDFLLQRGYEADYLGVDISAEMIEAARVAHAGTQRCRFLVGDRADRIASFTVASGIFNVRPGIDDSAWKAHALAVLDCIRETSEDGFAFNCLSLFSDPDRRREYLFYVDPCEMFKLCKERYARNVALLHDYDLYEFTVLVRLRA